MAAFATIIPWALQLLVQLPALIRAAEEAFGGGGTGPKKKEFVVSAVSSALDIATGVAKIKELERPGAKQAIVDVAGKLTDTIVAGYNATGIFLKDGEDRAPSGGH